MAESLERSALRRHVVGAVAAAQRAAGESIELVLYRSWTVPRASTGISCPSPGSDEVARLQAAAVAFRKEALDALTLPEELAVLRLVPSLIKAFYSRVEYDSGVRWSRHWIAWRRVEPPPLDGNLQGWAARQCLPPLPRRLPVDAIATATPRAASSDGAGGLS